MRVTAAQGAVPGAGLEVKRTSEKNSRNTSFCSPPQLHARPERHLCDRADVGPLGTSASLTCHGAESPHSAHRSPEPRAVAAPASSALPRAGKALSWREGPRRPAAPRRCKFVWSFWQLSVATSSDPTRPAHSWGYVNSCTASQQGRALPAQSTPAQGHHTDTRAGLGAEGWLSLTGPLCLCDSRTWRPRTHLR